MFIDEITVFAKAGNGGDGVVRWLRERSRPWGGPAGGNGGKGGDIYVRTVRNNNILQDYTGHKEFIAGNGESGAKLSQHGHGGKDVYIDVPIGSVVTNLSTGRKIELFGENEAVLILKGGTGGLGNEYFKSSTNRSPEESTPGRQGESAEFLIEVELVVDAGFIGLPNAGKSTLLNLLTRARSKIGAYPFTTLEPHLGDLYGYTLADIPGLIEGAASGKGLGHKFLRHVKRTKVLVHCVSGEEENVADTYATVRSELNAFDESLLSKTEVVILTKCDLLLPEEIEEKRAALAAVSRHVFTVSQDDADSIKALSDGLIKILRGEG